MNVMLPVLRALTAVHGEGFIHRDVTPDNIYITKDGMVKLLDFGSARYSIGDKSKSLDVILKVGYAPKEQYIRRSRQGPFTDVYSCAACFYAAITGFLPPESLERLDHDELVPISQAGIEIPEYLDKAILKGLAVQPEDRFQSAAEFLEATSASGWWRCPSPAGRPAAAPTVGGQVDALIGKVKQKPRLYGAIAAAAAVVLIAAGVLGGGNSVPDDPGGDLSAVEGGEVSQQPELPEPEPEPEPVTLTIAGEEHSSNDTYLSLWQVELTAEDIETICQMPKLEELSIYECYSDDDFAFLPRLTSLKSLDWTPEQRGTAGPSHGLHPADQSADRLGRRKSGLLQPGLSGRHDGSGVAGYPCLRSGGHQRPGQPDQAHPLHHCRRTDPRGYERAGRHDGDGGAADQLQQHPQQLPAL